MDEAGRGGANFTYGVIFMVALIDRRFCVIDPKDYTMSDAVAFMTGVKEPPRDAMAA